MSRFAPAVADEEQQLVARASRGDREAFGRLYERHALRVYRHAFFLTGDQTLAEDLTAQTFLNALQAIPRYEPRGVPFIAWLLRIATNLFINHRKALKNRHTPLPDTVEARGSCYSPEQSCETTFDSQRVWDEVRKLSDEQRQVMVMRFIDDLGYPEIAQILGKSVGAVRVIQFRALANLRHLLEDGELNHEYRHRAS